MPLGPFPDIHEPIIKETKASYFAGQSLTMSLINDRTSELFRSFMPNRNNYQSIDKGVIVYDIRVYPKDYYEPFNPSSEYTKWAAIRIDKDKFQENPKENISIESGLYAQFTILGNEAPPDLFQYIFSTWLPQSLYQLDDRAHFDMLWPDLDQRGAVSKQVICIPIV